MLPVSSSGGGLFGRSEIRKGPRTPLIFGVAGLPRKAVYHESATSIFGSGWFAEAVAIEIRRFARWPSRLLDQVSESAG